MGPILERFWGPKSNQNRSKIGLKSDHSTKTRIFVSTHENQWFLHIFHSPGGQKSTKNRLKSDLKLRCQRNIQKCSKKCPTWLQHGLKWGPSSAPKSSQERKNRHRKPHRKRHRKNNPTDTKNRNPPTTAAGRPATSLPPEPPSLLTKYCHPAAHRHNGHSVRV